MSVAVHETVVLPTENSLPDAGEQLLEAIPALSVAVNGNVTIADAVAPSGDVAMSAGQVTTGGITSFTLTLKAQELVKPALSMAKQFTVVVVALTKLLPDAGVHVRDWMPEPSDAVNDANDTLAFV